jgi:hypothetical protein
MRTIGVASLDLGCDLLAGLVATEVIARITLAVAGAIAAPVIDGRKRQPGGFVSRHGGRLRAISPLPNQKLTHLVRTKRFMRRNSNAVFAR